MTISDPEQDVLGLSIELQGLDGTPLFPDEEATFIDIGDQYFTDGQLHSKNFSRPPRR